MVCGIRMINKRLQSVMDCLFISILLILIGMIIHIILLQSIGVVLTIGLLLIALCVLLFIKDIKKGKKDEPK